MGLWSGRSPNDMKDGVNPDVEKFIKQFEEYQKEGSGIITCPKHPTVRLSIDRIASIPYYQLKCIWCDYIRYELPEGIGLLSIPETKDKK